MTQNYISENWYKGGESNHALLGNLRMFANYNDKEKIEFENLLELQIGFNTVSEKLDTMHTYRVNTDKLRLSSKLGLQTIFSKYWYYTLSGEFNTQLFHTYTANTNNVISAFMSPANLVFSIGMDYKLKKEKAIDLSVLLSPFSYNCHWVKNSKVDETKFGLEKGESALENWGPKLQTTFSWTIIPTVVLDSRLIYFTTYKKVDAEWESTVNFILNRYLSTKLHVYYRYEDGVERVEDYSYLQTNELLSFGINYRW
jgi:hypothetical protein